MTESFSLVVLWALGFDSAMRANKASIRDGGKETVDSPTAGAAASSVGDGTEVPHDIVATRAIAAEITTRGAKLYDLLKEEQTLRDARNKALRFLDAIAGNLDSRAEHAHLERSIRDAIAAVQDNVVSLEKQVADLQSDQKAIDRKLKKAQQELERGEKRMKSLQTVRCALVVTLPPPPPPPMCALRPQLPCFACIRCGCDRAGKVTCVPKS